MKVSVVIPTYNVESFLEQAVESVFGTCYPDLEILIVEDGLEDNTLEAAQVLKQRYDFSDTEKGGAVVTT